MGNIQNHYFECDCKYCNRHFFQKNSKSFHEKYCKLNPNRVMAKGHNVPLEQRENISKKMKDIAKNRWNNPSYRALNSARQYLSKFQYNSNGIFYIYYAYDSTLGLYKVGLTQDIKSRESCFDNAIADGEYIKIREFFNIKEAVLCEAMVTLKFYDGNKEFYSFEKVNDILNFVKSFDYSENSLLPIAKDIFSTPVTSKKCPKWKLKQEDRILKYKKAVEDEKITSSGLIKWNLLSEEDWNKRLDLILNSGVDLKKYGFITKLTRTTTLSKNQIYKTIKHFNLDVYKLHCD